MTRMPGRGVTVELRDQQRQRPPQRGAAVPPDRPARWCWPPPPDRAGRPAVRTRHPVAGQLAGGRHLLGAAGAAGRARASGRRPCWWPRWTTTPGARSGGEYVRSSLDAAVLLDFEADDSEGEPGRSESAAELIDLSEVALRGIVPPGAPGLAPAAHPGTGPARAGRGRLRDPGYVLLAKPAARLDLGLEVVVLFDRPVPRVEELRAHLGGWPRAAAERRTAVERSRLAAAASASRRLRRRLRITSRVSSTPAPPSTALPAGDIAFCLRVVLASSTSRPGASRSAS